MVGSTAGIESDWERLVKSVTKTVIAQQPEHHPLTGVGVQIQQPTRMFTHPFFEADTQPPDAVARLPCALLAAWLTRRFRMEEHEKHKQMLQGASVRWRKDHPKRVDPLGATPAESGRKQPVLLRRFV
jgi:hypothetical protein